MTKVEEGVSKENLHTVYLSLGSNLGDRHAIMRRAIAMINEEVGRVDRESSPLETEPWGFESANMVLNMCVSIKSVLSPEQILTITQDIERKLGRKAKSVDGEYHDRPIDIDILMYDDLHITTPTLTLPHPLMHERDFVMIPLREILE